MIPVVNVCTTGSSSCGTYTRTETTTTTNAKHSQDISAHKYFWYGWICTFVIDCHNSNLHKSQNNSCFVVVTEVNKLVLHTHF